MKRQSESLFKKAIRDYLTLKGWLCIPIRSVGIYRKDTGEYIPLKMKGVSDIICCTPEGRFVAIEVKTTKGKLNIAQKNFLQNVQAHKGIGIVARTLDDVILDVCREGAS